MYFLMNMYGCIELLASRLFQKSASRNRPSDHFQTFSRYFFVVGGMGGREVWVVTVLYKVGGGGGVHFLRQIEAIQLHFFFWVLLKFFRQ